MDFLECVRSADLTEYEQLQKAKGVFESDDWKEYRDDAAQELKKRKELYYRLEHLRDETCQAEELLWQDPSISFARDIHRDIHLRDLDDAKIDAKVLKKKVRKYCRRAAGLAGALLVACGVTTITMSDGLFETGIWLMIAALAMMVVVWLLAGDPLIEEEIYRKNSPAKLRDIVSAMALVKRTEQYKAILELENFEQLIAQEMELCSWPPVEYHSPQARA